VQLPNRTSGVKVCPLPKEGTGHRSVPWAFARRRQGSPSGRVTFHIYIIHI
jgi:hypothetical protein